MASLEQSAIEIANRLGNEPVLVMFSGGKDSIVAADLMVKHYRGPMIFVYLYFVDGLKIKESVLSWYQARFKAEIHHEPSPETASLATGKRVKMADIEAGLRRKYDTSYLVQGVRKCESMARRGMLKHLEFGIDHKYKKLYPVGDWSDREIWSYIKLHKLKVPIEYSFGMKHDIWVPDGAMMLFFKHNFQDDYRKIIAAYPQLETMTKREEMFPE